MMWQFIRGYVILHLEAPASERILSALFAKGVRVRRVRRESACACELELCGHDVFTLFSLRRRYAFRMHIAKKRGLPFLWRRLWRRKALLFGTAFVFAAFCFLSTRVLITEVRGCERMDEQVLWETLENAGVRRYMRHRGVDFVRIANDTAALFDEIAWLGLHREGVMLTVEVKESLPLQKIEDINVPCDVVAIKAGVVVSVTMLRGKALVKTGDRVTDGQVLITGTVRYKDAAPYLTRARGTVTAAVVYEARIPAPETERELAETGEEKPFFRLRIGSATVFETRCPYPFAREEAGDGKPLGNLFASVVLERGVYRELRERERTLTAAEQKEAALVAAEAETVKLLPAGADVIVKAAWTEEENGVTVGVCRITTEENIAIQREIMHGANDGTGED